MRCSIIPLHHISLFTRPCPRLLLVSKNSQKKVIHDKNTPCVFPPRAAPELPNAPKYRALAHVSPIGSTSIRLKADHPFCSVPFPSPRMFLRLRPTRSAPLTPSMVTLTRQRGHSHTTVHVHVRWGLPTHRPHTWTARVPTIRTTVPHRTPHLTSIAPRIKRIQLRCVLGSRSHARGWVSMFRTRSSAS